jgi:hypothetical protein
MLRCASAARVTTQNEWIKEFAFCETHDRPADFVSTHLPTDTFGTIKVDTVTQFAHAPRDVMQDRALDVRRQAGGRW